MKSLAPIRNFENLIFEFRGIKVMIDIDLAALYETETKRLKEQVKRNRNRFPKDFMFQLTKDERVQLMEMAPRLKNLKHSTIAPLAFTEQGVAMLSSVLNSRKAVQINIEIMRAFARYRAYILENNDLRKEVMALDTKLNEAFKYLLEKIDALAPQYTHRKKIGYRRIVEKD